MKKKHFSLKILFERERARVFTGVVRGVEGAGQAEWH